MTSLDIDHVTIAGSSLEPMRRAFAALGLATDYGGLHSNGITHMALLGFDDGSYIELISSLQPGRMDTAFWGKHIANDGGPCAWAARVEDVAAEVQRLAKLGIAVEGPVYYYRQRPDGILVEWNLAFLDDKGAGAQLPFLIEDISPREWRVRPSASVSGGPLTGLNSVILGVNDLAAATALFQKVYGWPQPQVAATAQFGATLAYFAGTPVMLAAPLTAESWLARRLEHFSESPCAYLIGASDFAAACEQFQLIPAMTLFGRAVAWFEPDKLNGVYLGVAGSVKK